MGGRSKGTPWFAAKDTELPTDGQGWPQRERLVSTMTVTVALSSTAPSSVTTAPLLDDSFPRVVVQMKVGFSTPVQLARNVGRTPGSNLMSQVTSGHGGSLKTKVAVQFVCPNV